MYKSLVADFTIYYRDVSYTLPDGQLLIYCHAFFDNGYFKANPSYLVFDLSD